ncbi:hypothetical protein [Pseudofrankia inefficax]|nr:hypothetical protein [Pseudofrankia inefficax]
MYGSKYDVDLDRSPLTYRVGGTWYTIAQFATLPADPAVLGPMIVDDWPQPVADRTVYTAATDLLRLPVSPAVQAALFTIVRSLETATTNEHDRDLIGRPAVSVSVPDPENPGTFNRVYFTPESHHYLGQDENGKVNNPCTFDAREVVLASGWVGSIGQTVPRHDHS